MISLLHTLLILKILVCWKTLPWTSYWVSSTIHNALGIQRILESFIQQVNNQITCLRTPSAMRNLILLQTDPSVSKHLLLCTSVCFSVPLATFLWKCSEWVEGPPPDTLTHQRLSLYLPCLCSLGQLSPVLSTNIQMVVLIYSSCPFPNTPLANVPFKMWYSELNELFPGCGVIRAECLCRPLQCYSCTTWALYSHSKLLTHVRSVNN